ncbi:HU family DNA-binding protein [Velocimicrobium porci]|uniref:DNA-binding protein n=1 Tax=Velocimicrobium porci TaxID=2606634 RepID=A0A6L5XXZ4_9FIRM|nr:HU family DNA-binding protein [Velocimicrobium porci]MSS63655.1 hypothetical protein [Velocimicrobium porci]
MDELKKIGISPYKMAGRIAKKADNKIYKREYVYDILKMYMEEIQSALLRGERVQISGVGTIIPEVKTRENYSLPCCNKADGNPPYTAMRMSRTNTLHDKMNEKLLENIENGIYGLEKLPFSKQQMTYLKNGGFIPEDAEFKECNENYEEE